MYTESVIKYLKYFFFYQKCDQKMNFIVLSLLISLNTKGWIEVLF